MKSELTKKDNKLIKFLTEFSVCKKKHLSCFVGYNQKCLFRLQQNNKIVVEENLIKIKNIQVEGIELQNVLKVLDILSILYQKGKITKDIIGMDLPYYAAAKVANVEAYLYFTIINIGKENIQCKLIDRDNYGNVVLILEEKEQINNITLNNQVEKIYIYNEVINN
ncbi:hypothetical protein SH1V18_47930 [Vallitalea longa]|uniref:Uncharacterized protein n=1 Tax=Vallitalea longa TaxID=2936439 RepID=A0A9W6DIB0_9FIRM|nr:hypothetical protein [Vallitalea longa]GKX32313.1 hypothetical protein SH1V18_47930 [Vallitalea longa]